MRRRPVERDLVLIGGGHTHLAVLRSFAMTPLPGVRPTLVARAVETPYSGMLPGLIAGTYDHDTAHVDLAALCRAAGARLIAAEAVGLDRAARRVALHGRPSLRYDLVSLDIGSTPRADVPGAAEHATPLKPVDALSRRWRAVEARVRAADLPLTLAVVGGGAAGAEVALAAEHRLRLLSHHPPRVVLVTRGPLLGGGRVRRLVRQELARRGIVLEERADVTGVSAGRLHLADGRALPFDEALWATQARAAPWLAETGLPLDEDGFVLVDETLRSPADPRVFAAGDVATMIGHPRPKAGVMAVRQGPPLTDNLRRTLLGRPPKRFRPQARFLALIGTGDGRAFATRGHWATGPAAWIWRWKDHVDRRFMRRYRDLPEMRPPAPDPEAPMRCAGCGGKVPADVLRRALARLGVEASPQDAAPVPDAGGAPLMQSVDVFTALVDDPWLMGRIAAVHALGDVQARGGRALAALATVALPAATDAILEDDLVQVLAGALGPLEEAGCTLIGGHTREDDTLTLGFAITATAGPLGKDGLRPGDALVLTKPLGTGTLFAAAMRGRARARWLLAALASMQRPAGHEAAVLAHTATACTDVTGFGLLGHLTEMLEASGCDAFVDLAALPRLDGAAETLAAGLTSSLHPANARFACGLEGPADPILFDPQTAGGLLAGVPPEALDATLDALHRAGVPTVVIGRAVPRAGDRPRVLAEADGNRTHRPPRRRTTGFEDQGGHQTPFASESS